MLLLLLLEDQLLVEEQQPGQVGQVVWVLRGHLCRGNLSGGHVSLLALGQADVCQLVQRGVLVRLVA